jgi:hypothetical protein
VAVATALSVAIMLSAGSRTDQPRTDGPLVVQDATTVTGWTQDVGTVVSFGATTISNPTDTPMIVTGVEPHFANSDGLGFSVDSVYLVDLSGVEELVAVWVGATHTSEGAEPVLVPGATLDAHTRYQVVFVTTLIRVGKWTMPSFGINYQMYGVAYVAEVPSGLRLCAPTGVEC